MISVTWLMLASAGDLSRLPCPAPSPSSEGGVCGQSSQLAGLYIQQLAYQHRHTCRSVVRVRLNREASRPRLADARSAGGRFGVCLCVTLAGARPPLSTHCPPPLSLQLVPSTHPWQCGWLRFTLFIYLTCIFHLPCLAGAPEKLDT